jgi:hypothetical protein
VCSVGSVRRLYLDRESAGRQAGRPPILSSQRMLREDYNRKGSVAKEQVSGQTTLTPNVSGGGVGGGGAPHPSKSLRSNAELVDSRRPVNK